MLPRRVVLNCLARTCCINAAVTARGMQQIGLASVLAPAFNRLYPESSARARAFARYGGHSNTHVFMVPLYVGIVLALEEQIARGSLPEGAVGVVRETLATTLSALGAGQRLPAAGRSDRAYCRPGSAVSGVVAALPDSGLFRRTAPRHVRTGAAQAPEPH